MYTYLEPQDDGLPTRETGKWARVKLDYLARYIAVFESSMRDKWPLRNYLDLLAGPGKNRLRETGEILLGSPLLALTTKYPFTGHHFVEYDPANAQALSQRCMASDARARIQVHTGDCNVLVDQVVADLRRDERRSLNLAFLDPEGLELQWTTVAKLATIRRMDLILKYPQGGLNRLMRQAYDANTETVVDRYFGGDSWRTIYAQWLKTRRSGLHRQLIDLYRDRLRMLGYAEVRGDDEVGDEPLMRNAKRNAPLYRLLFASKHPLGKEFWHSVTRRDVYGQRRLLE